MSTKFSFLTRSSPRVALHVLPWLCFWTGVSQVCSSCSKK